MRGGGGQRPFGIFPKIDPFWWRHLSLTTLTQHLSNHNLFAQVSMAATWAQHLTKAKVGVEEVKTDIFHRWDAIFFTESDPITKSRNTSFFLNLIKQWKPEICDGYWIASQKRETLNSSFLNKFELLKYEMAHFYRPGSNYGSYTTGSQGIVAIFTGSGVVDGQDSDWWFFYNFQFLFLFFLTF